VCFISFNFLMAHHECTKIVLLNMDGSHNTNTMEVERKENQIFVRNLAYQTTSEDLIALFEEFGPMKRATIVQQDGVSRGFGFVKFALEEDASTAMRALQGRELHGRKMKLEVAVQRGQSTKGAAGGQEQEEDDVLPPSSPSASVSAPEEQKKEKEKEENTLLTSNSHLQLLVAGVPPHVNKKVFRDAVLKSLLPFKCKKLLVELIKPEHPMFAQLCPDSLLPAGRVMLLTAPSRQDVPRLAALLDNATAKALGLAAVAEQQQQGGAAVPKVNMKCRTLKEVTPLQSRKQKCRLILRNLSFQATEENVASRLLKFGPLAEVTIPRIEVDHAGGGGGGDGSSMHAKSRFGKKQREQKGGGVQLKPRGFAFVMFLCEEDAGRAVQGSEGLKICNREFALDFCQHKYGYGFANEEKEGEEGEEEEEKKSSDREEEGSESEEEEEEEEGDAASDYSGEEMHVDSDSDAESEPGSEMEWDGSDSEDDDHDLDEEEEKEEEKKKEGAAAPDVNEKRTVFVRDMAYDADQRDVQKVFRQFGPVEFAVIVLGTC
jgi:RNA recognition motif-containing protein